MHSTSGEMEREKIKQAGTSAKENLALA